MPCHDKDFRYTDIWVCFGDMYKGPRIKVGLLPNNQIHEYLDILNKFMLPKSRCIQYHFYFVLHSHPFKEKDKMKLNQSLYIIATNTNYVKYLCGAKDGESCLGSMKCGNCKEEFVRECIGKYFFPKQYKNNQR